ncbi:MAG TPA: hypothetical protein DDX14_09350 [Cyanobacteria bacterium UBA9579]|nr:hypothetical protein [Cyanobacteria bacterium UBA9579]
MTGFCLEINCPVSKCDAFTGNSNHAQVWNAIKPYFSVVKDCGTAAGQGCFPKGVMYKYLNGSDERIVDDISEHKGLLNDGASLALWSWSGCAYDRSIANRPPLLTLCGEFIVDINGSKGPNQ